MFLRMSVSNRLFVVLMLALVAGCAFFSGDIEEGMPKLRDKLPESTKVYLANALNPRGGRLYARNGQLVVDEFRAAFKARGISVTVPDRRSGVTVDVLEDARTNGCDVVVFTQVLRWDYGEAGFTGLGGRDEVYLSVLLMRPETQRVVTRANIRVYNGIGHSPAGGNDDPGESVSPIIRKYVDSLFKDRDGP